MSAEFSSRNTRVPAAEIAAGLGYKISLTPYIEEVHDKPVEQPPATSPPRRTRAEFAAVLSFPNRPSPPPLMQMSIPTRAKGVGTVEGWLSKILRF